MLAAAGRPDIPVIGNLAEVGGLRDQFDVLGAAAFDVFNIGLTQQRGFASIRAFGAGLLDVLNVVVNTEATRFVPGTHWIAVQLWRRPDGQISIVYLDSFDAPSDYSGLFNGLRAFFGHIPPHVAHHGDGEAVDRSRSSSPRFGFGSSKSTSDGPSSKGFDFGDFGDGTGSL